MLILDENDHEVNDPDLDKGYLFKEIRVKPDAEPIDDITKFAWDDSDYEEIQRYKLYTSEDQKDFSVLRRRAQLEAAATLFVRSTLLTNEQALTVSEFYEEWLPDDHYLKNDIRRFKDNLYRCLSDHDGQASWTPDQAHSLWVQIRPEGEIQEWEQVQPGVNEPYKKGDKVTHKGKTWISDIDNNVWEPGVYGWSEVA